MESTFIVILFDPLIYYKIEDNFKSNETKKSEFDALNLKMSNIRSELEKLGKIQEYVIVLSETNDEEQLAKAIVNDIKNSSKICNSYFVDFFTIYYNLIKPFMNINMDLFFNKFLKSCITLKNNENLNFLNLFEDNFRVLRDFNINIVNLEFFKLNKDFVNHMILIENFQEPDDEASDIEFKEFIFKGEKLAYHIQSNEDIFYRENLDYVRFPSFHKDFNKITPFTEHLLNKINSQFGTKLNYCTIESFDKKPAYRTKLYDLELFHSTFIYFNTNSKFVYKNIFTNKNTELEVNAGSLLGLDVIFCSDNTIEFLETKVRHEIYIFRNVNDKNYKRKDLNELISAHSKLRVYNPYVLF
jgi:hypothetical protein